MILHLVDPVELILDPIDLGGTLLKLGERSEAHLTRNEGAVNIDELSVSLPRFTLSELGVEFSAPQFDILISDDQSIDEPQREMRFEMLIPSKEEEIREEFRSKDKSSVEGQGEGSLFEQGRCRLDQNPNTKAHVER